jgi:hypothetical protein
VPPCFDRKAAAAKRPRELGVAGDSILADTVCPQRLLTRGTTWRASSKSTTARRGGARAGTPAARHSPHGSSSQSAGAGAACAAAHSRQTPSFNRIHQLAQFVG